MEKINMRELKKIVNEGGTLPDRWRKEIVREKEISFPLPKKETPCECGVCWECRKPKKNAFGRAADKKMILECI
jgi:hypothetical protein